MRGHATKLEPHTVDALTRAYMDRFARCLIFDTPAEAGLFHGGILGKFSAWRALTAVRVYGCQFTCTNASPSMS